MRRIPQMLIAVLGAGAMVTSVFSGALASQPTLRPQAQVHKAKSYTVNGNLTITSVLRVNKNHSVYGRLYAHGGEQVWQGLLVRSGGLKADSLTVVGASSFAGQAAFQNNVTVGGTLQAAGPINGSSLTLSGAATVGGALTVNDRITAGQGGITTAGPLSAGSVSTGTLTTTGNVNTGAGTITTSGLTAGGNISTTGAVSARDLTVTGTVNLTGATVTGLNGGANGGTGTFNTLTIGSTGGSTNPLTLAANGHTAALGVNSSGALTVGDLAATGSISAAGNANVAGNLTVAGTSGVVTSVLQAPVASGTTTQGALTIQGNGINLNGNTTLANGSDLVLTIPNATLGTGSATHIVSSGDRDVAGRVTLAPTASGASTMTGTVTFVQQYAAPPVVVVTPEADPLPSGGSAPKVWVTASQTGFIIHYAAPSGVAAPASLIYDYQVIGS